ncbi:MAG: respiratory nitrate reductase subunit gamma [Gammaproteobacteria bacterium]|nr:respiratory nitrate reductase subunit gamma [Gammaproteobacteria bacterium]
MKILQAKGSVTEDDLRRITNSIETKSRPRVEKNYSSSDWVIIALGLVAAIVLGIILYN